VKVNPIGKTTLLGLYIDIKEVKKIIWIYKKLVKIKKLSEKYF